MEFYEQKKLGLYVLIWIVCFFLARYVFLWVEIYFGFELDSFLSFVLTIFTFEIIARTSSKIAYMRKAAGWLIYDGSCVRTVETGWRWIRPGTIFKIPKQEFSFSFPLLHLNIKPRFGWTIRVRVDNTDMTAINAFVFWVHQMLDSYKEKGQDQKDLRLRISIMIDNAIRNHGLRFTVLERTNH